MARYMYQARDSQGELASGVVCAASIDEAGASLRDEGKFIVKLNEIAEQEEHLPEMTLEQRARRVKKSDVMFFAHQMAIMLETGVPLAEALECVVDQAPNPHFCEVLRDVTNNVQAGNEFSSSLKRFPTVFPPVMISLLRASEVSGTMGPMLERISRYMAKEQKIQRQARGAMLYPCVMMLVAVTVTVFLIAFVLPKFAGIYASKGSSLPAPTRLLMGFSEIMTGYWWVWSGGLIVLGLVLHAILKTEQGRRGVDWLKLNTPIVKHLFTQLYVTRACRTMGTMIGAGVSMLDAVAIVKEVTNNRYFEDMWDDVENSLQQGLQLSDPLFRSTLIPRSIVQMVRSGEKSGRLGEVMGRIAEFTEEEFDVTVKSTTQFIEPLMIGIMGVIIGFVAVALLMPIFSVGRVIAGG